jgi:hypothetical protein
VNDRVKTTVNIMLDAIKLFAFVVGIIVAICCLRLKPKTKVD